MAKTPVIAATMAVGLMFLLELVGLATPHWMDIKGLKLHFGVFQICLSNVCFTFIGYLGFSIHYLGFAACQSIGAIIMLLTTISGIVGATNGRRPEKTIIKNLAALSFVSAFFILTSVTWFALSFYNNIGVLYSLYTSEPVTLGYSFVLSTVSGIGMLVIAITCCVIAQNMPAPPLVAQAPQPVGQPMIIMATTNQQFMYQHPNGQQPITGQPQGHFQGQQQLVSQPPNNEQGNLAMQPTYLPNQPGYGHPGAPPGGQLGNIPPPVYSGQPSASGDYGPPAPNPALPGGMTEKPPLQ
ncbi:uncharacterized protein LOC117324047 [Pecten maximus]|uniref:uncharacterized protein LOC117324047 n=1 Tax=Pecten maximus TaxID=6579 RepID=UPI0014588EBF|nr:uncharacterized protein LOC117324047 [Pecten maximus]